LSWGQDEVKYVNVHRLAVIKAGKE